MARELGAVDHALGARGLARCRLGVRQLLHADRVVKGWPDAWRPERIFGLNRNDLLNQRLLGEIHLDGFEVTHTKDNIQWYGDEDEQFEKKLGDAISDLISVARTPWKDQDDARRPSEAEIDIAISGIREELPYRRA